jgi:hypothetical protein
MKNLKLEMHFAAAAALCVAGAANAAIVYSGTLNFVCAVDIDGCYINVETGVLSNGPGSGVPGWDVNPYSTSGGMNFFNSTGGGQMRRPGVTTGTAGNLALGTVIGAAGSYNTGTGNVYGTTAATGLNGGWTYSSENIIGFKFVSAAGTTHYGWMRFAMFVGGVERGASLGSCHDDARGHAAAHRGLGRRRLAGDRSAAGQGAAAGAGLAH